MAFARTDTLDQRLSVLERLVLRNRVVGVLRVAVPLLGVAALAALTVQIMVANMLNHYGVAGIRIDRGKLVVETPQYSGMGSDGTRYLITAQEARAPLENPNAIEMTGVALDYSRPGRSGLHARADAAAFDSSAQQVDVPGLVTLHGDDGLHGTLMQFHADMVTEVSSATGPVDVTFGNGTRLTAANMLRDGRVQTWTFERATLIVPQLPRGPYPVPDFARHGWVMR